MDTGAWLATVHSVPESDKTEVIEHAHTHFSTHRIYFFSVKMSPITSEIFHYIFVLF